jgi:hypothetical protein
VRLLPSVEEGVNVYRYALTELPGDYTLSFEGPAAGSFPFYVERDPAESDLKPLPAASREALLASARMRFVAEPLTWPADTPLAPRRIPAWGALLLAVTLFLGLELALICYSTWRRVAAAKGRVEIPQPV